MKNELKKEFQERFFTLRKILNAWDLIPGAPKDEFDFLNHQILSHLYKGADIEKITNVLTGELTVYYGLTTNPQDIKSFTEEIFGWWNSTE